MSKVGCRLEDPNIETFLKSKIGLKSMGWSLNYTIFYKEDFTEGIFKGIFTKGIYKGNLQYIFFDFKNP